VLMDCLIVTSVQLAKLADDADCIMQHAACIE
jgi:hypothetical protein